MSTFRLPDELTSREWHIKVYIARFENFCTVIRFIDGVCVR
jgi:hypothetical protein